MNGSEEYKQGMTDAQVAQLLEDVKDIKAQITALRDSVAGIKAQAAILGGIFGVVAAWLNPFRK